MSQAVATAGMTGEQMVALCKQHSLYEWSAQGAVDPIPVARAKGIYFWTPEDKRYIDFNSQLMCVNAGHGHPAIIKAIQDQAASLAYTNPFMASEARARLGAKLAAITPGDMDVFFFTNGGAEGNENAIRIARAVTGRHKILARYRSYHGGTAGSLTLTGDPRRWAAEPGIPGVVHVLDPYHGMARGWDTAEQALRYLEEVIELEGPKHIAAFIIETISGTNGILVPPDGYLQGVRALCDKHGILLICDEVMAGFGRTGTWFGVDHWNVVPDLMTMAKGLTSAYVALGAVGMRRRIAEHFREKAYNGGTHLQQPPARLRDRTGHHQGVRRRGDDRERAHHGRGDGGAPQGSGRQASVGGRGAQHRPVRHPRAHPQPQDDGADGADARQFAGDAGARQVLPAGRALHLRAVAHVLHQPAALHHRGRAARGLRDHRQGARDHRPGGRRRLAGTCDCHRM